MRTPSLRTTSIDAVFIVTRHSAHADLTCRALEAGKAVFVEKPLALTTRRARPDPGHGQTTGNDRIMVGFNRRFAPLLVDMRSRFGRYIRADERPLPGQCRTAGVGQLVSGRRTRGFSFRGRRWSFRGHMSWWIGSDPVEVSGTARGESRRNSDEPALRGRITRRPSPMSRMHTAAFRRRPSKPPAAAGRHDWTTSDVPPCGQATHARTRRYLGAQTRASRPRSGPSSSPCEPDGPMPISLDR